MLDKRRPGFLTYPSMAFQRGRELKFHVAMRPFSEIAKGFYTPNNVEISQCFRYASMDAVDKVR